MGDLTVTRRGLALALPLTLFARAVRGQEAEGDPAAVALLQRAAAAMARLSTFRFRLTTLEGATTLFEEITLESVEGIVKRPDQFQATITASVAFLAVRLEVVGIGETIWVEDPLSAEGSYREVSLAEAGEIAELLNPDRIFLAAVRLVETPAIAGEDEVEGIAATVVEGEFRPIAALGLLGTPVPTPSAEEQAAAGLILDRPLFAQLWIDASDRVIQLALQGPLTTSEEPNIIRLLRLWGFDEPVEITPPV